LARIEHHLEGEPSTGVVWSFLDFLEEAHRLDRGRAARSLESLAAAAPDAMPIVSSLEGVASFWSEGTPERVRVSVHRRWLNAREQIPYLARLGRFVDALNAELAPAGYHVELAGGLELAARAERRIRATQWTSFGGAFGVVAAAMGAALWRSPALLL